MNDTPKLIPRRLVFRAFADILGGRARHLQSRSPERTLRRRPDAGNVRPKPFRAVEAARLLSEADEVGRWIGDPGRYQGEGIDAAVFGYLVAIAYGHAEALPELVAELADVGRPGLLDDLRHTHLLAILDRLMPAS